MSDTTAIIGASIALVGIMALLSGYLAYAAARRVPADAYRRYEHAIADMQQRLERTEQRSDRQQEQIDRLRDALVMEQDYNRALARAMRDAGLEPPPRPEPPARPEPQRLEPARTPSDLAALAHKVAVCFSLEEIETLAFGLQMDGALTGETLENRAASLVRAALRRGQLAQLIEIARRDRPKGGF